MRSTYEQSKLKLDSLKRYVDNLDTLIGLSSNIHRGCSTVNLH